jgi:hypothetical protein
MNKLTDEEIIKSFTRTYEQYNEKGDFRTTAYKEILDLIKRKDAQIQGLQDEVIIKTEMCDKLMMENEKLKQDVNWWKTNFDNSYTELQKKEEVVKYKKLICFQEGYKQATSDFLQSSETFFKRLMNE